MQYLVLTTGSCGNSYVFYEGDEAIVVDMGVTMTKLVRVLEEHSISLSSVEGLFLTHLHPDHSKGAGVLSRKTEIPIYLSQAAVKLQEDVLTAQRIEKKRLTPFNMGDSVTVGSFSVTSFKTSHDSAGSCGYFIENGDKRIFLMTDTGVIPDVAYAYAKNSRLKFIESNYDDEMLKYGPYSPALKKRVAGDYGHLSNTSAIEFAKKTSRRGDHVFFVHISENNNDYALIDELIKRNLESGIFSRPLKRGESYEGFLDEE